MINHKDINQDIFLILKQISANKLSVKQNDELNEITKFMGRVIEGSIVLDNDKVKEMWEKINFLLNARGTYQKLKEYDKANAITLEIANIDHKTLIKQGENNG